MIKIENVIPIDKSVKVEVRDLVDQFYEKVSPTIVTKINELYASNGTTPAQKQFIDAELRGDRLKALITAIPTDLEALKKRIERDYVAVLDKAFKKRILMAFGYSERFRSTVTKAGWLAKQLNVRACPYCNGQFTLYSEHTNRGKRKYARKTAKLLKFQFDHFFDKADYPYLSMSFYNLIPSCGPCNNTKSKTKTKLGKHYHPYYDDLDVVSVFKTTIDDFDSPFEIKENQINVSFQPRTNAFVDFVAEHNDLYHIDGIYERHKDRVKEVIVNSVLYTKELRHQLEEIEGLIPDDRSFLLRFLLGSHGLREEIPLRPLNKLVRDTAIQYGLIDEDGNLTGKGT